jgi:hypothetical protein
MAGGDEELRYVAEYRLAGGALSKSDDKKRNWDEPGMRAWWP